MRYLAIVFWGCCLVLLAACDSTAQHTVMLSGSLTYPDPTPIPPGATAVISMRETGTERAGGRIVAERSLHDVGQKPIRFRIAIARSLASRDETYTVEARILSAQDVALWSTQDGTSFDPLADDSPVTMTLRSAQSPQSLGDVATNARDGHQ